MSSEDMKIYRAIGLMSGTSLDGLDVSLAEYKFHNSEWSFEFIKCASYNFDEALLESIKAALGSNMELEVRRKLDRQYAKWVADCVNDFLSGVEVEVDLIACHGQTIFHDPSAGVTIQIGDGRLLCDLTGLTVINDFRSKDIELGGQGAPLVPIGDKELFKDFMYCLNLGGIANISEKNSGSIQAYDICICNVGANYFANREGLAYDESGHLGAKGKVIPELMERWSSLEYFSEHPPKSLDATFFEREMLSDLDMEIFSTNDMLATLYESIAEEISRSVEFKKERILVTGGGAFNERIIELMIEKGLNPVVRDPDIINFKESLVFGFLGVLRLRNEINVLAQVTGASENHCSGVVYRTN